MSALTQPGTIEHVFLWGWFLICFPRGDNFAQARLCLSGSHMDSCLHGYHVAI